MHFSRKYDQWWRQEIILTIGALTFTREKCVRDLGCPNFRAAGNLSTALNSIGIDSVDRLATTTPKDLMRLEGVGERTVFVALCVLDAQASAKAAEKWLHSDERRATAPPPKPEPSAKEKAKARHTRPSGHGPVGAHARAALKRPRA